MAIASLIIASIALAISIISLFGVAIVFNALISQTNAHQNTNTQPTPENEEFNRGYTVGSTELWAAVQLAVFDMFREAEIFDCEGTLDNLTTKLTKVIQDESFRDTLHTDLQEYMKRVEDGSDSY